MPIHNPRNPYCRTPFGAIRTGETLTLQIAVPHTFAVCEAVLHCTFFDLEKDTAENAGISRDFPLSHSDSDVFGSEYAVFGIKLSLKGFVGLIFYHFHLQREGGEPYFYGQMDATPEHPDITGGIYQNTPCPEWQITVYRPQETPAWFGNGITYGIFPDRFCKSGKTTSDTPLSPWNAVPKYLPDTDGIIRRDDFFGGDLEGIRSRLPYLHSLGVRTLYLNPIFAAYSNHRYDTADYEHIDPRLGTEDDFCALCTAAHELGMRVLLDGVFSHTGSVSRYFNVDGRFPDSGAAQSPSSPYFLWYRFRNWPDDYECWWDVKSLPCTNEEEPTYLDYILRSEDSIVRRWTRAGADGWRLDVADELPDGFLDILRQTVKSERPDALVLGEVWEDASCKVAYSHRRRYLLGRQLDGVMNYPLRSCILDFLGGHDAFYVRQTVEHLQENYPPETLYSCLNFLGTHDTPRILNVLGADSVPESMTEQAEYLLNSDEYQRGKTSLMLASALLYAFPGSPMIFYGDEAGLCGWGDPFNRRGYPWCSQDRELIQWFTLLGTVRNHSEALQRGTLQFLYAQNDLLAFIRETTCETVLIIANRGTRREFICPWEKPLPDSLLHGSRAQLSGQTLKVNVPANTCVWLLCRTPD